ncbi:MAG: oxidoreductase [Microbacteriaceae bacterium]|nr:oxidoreductase [Microbacteriaceae bacterium]
MVTAGRPVAWHRARVVEARAETPRSRRLVLDVPTWPGNDAGSHLDIRLTAPDGYQASRSYSVGSSGDGTRVVLVVDEVPDGEVSPYLVRGLQLGDELEVHGPLGRFFVWRPPGAGADPAALAPVQLIAGGSGVVPLFAMASAHEAARDATELRLLYSVRSPEDAFFREEIATFEATRVDWAFTRRAPDGATRPPGRLTREALAELAVGAERAPRVFVCGPTAFVEAVAGWLVELGHAPAAIRTERFGGTP